MGEYKDSIKTELLKYTGNMSQIAGVFDMTYNAGKEQGVRIYHVRNGYGLEYDLMPGKALDIARLTYRGYSIAFQAKNGMIGPQYGYPVLNEFDRYFSGGMLVTCGLKNTGPDYIDEDGKFQHAHGRIGTSPCEQAYAFSEWEGDSYVTRACGIVRDTILGGHNLTLKREVCTGTANEVSITDTLENNEPEATDFVILYHFNFGYPFLTDKLKMDFPAEKKPIIPRTADAEKGIQKWKQMERPIDGEPEQVFFHHPIADESGYATIKLENPDLGIGVYLNYITENLPVLAQWKSTRSGEYVLGIEPGNSYIRGMASERENGTVGKIGAFASIQFKINLGFYDL